MKRILQILFIFLFFGVVSFGLKILFFPKGEWVCENGKWVRIGNPKKPSPSTPCLERQTIADKLMDKESSVSAGTPLNGFSESISGLDNAIFPEKYKQTSSSSRSSFEF